MPDIRIRTQFYHTKVDNEIPTNPISFAFYQLKNVAQDDSSRTSIIKTVRAAISLYDTLVGSSHQEIRNSLGAFTDTMRIFTLPTLISNLIRDRSSKLKTLINTSDLASAILSGFRVLDYMKVIQLSNLSTTLGKIPVIGYQVAKALPFANIVSIFDVFKSSLSIFQTTGEMRKRKTTSKKFQEKKDLWSDLGKEGNLDLIVAEKINKTRSKEIRAELYAKFARRAMKRKLKVFLNSEEKYTNAFNNLEKSKGPKRLLLKFKRDLSLKRFKRDLIAYEQAANKFREEQKNVDKYNLRRRNWDLFSIKIKEVPQPKEAIKRFTDLKVEKWNQKLLNDKRSDKDSKISIALNTAVIVISVASIALTILALSSVPFISIPLAAVGLTLAVTGLGISIWNKVREEISYKAVPLSMIWERQGAILQQVPA